MPTLPYELSQHSRRYIPKQQHKVMNWRAYDASLRQRGSLAVWFTYGPITDAPRRLVAAVLTFKFWAAGVFLAALAALGWARLSSPRRW